MALIGAGPAWLGVIEGVADGLSSFTKLAAGHFTDRLKTRKPLAVLGYAVTALATRGLQIEDFSEVGRIIAQTLTADDFEGRRGELAERAAAIAERYPLYASLATV